jgi:hypothetical protein
MATMFKSYEASVDTTPAASTPPWKTARLTADPKTPDIPAGSLSPIYPTTPGKELLGKPVFIAVRVSQKHREPAIRRPSVQQALRTNKLPRKFMRRASPIDIHSKAWATHSNRNCSHARPSILGTIFTKAVNS